MMESLEAGERPATARNATFYFAAALATAKILCSIPGTEARPRSGFHAL